MPSKANFEGHPPSATRPSTIQPTISTKYWMARPSLHSNGHMLKVAATTNRVDLDGASTASNVIEALYL